MRPANATASDDRLQGLEARLEAASPGYLARVREAAGRLGVRDAATTDADAAVEAVEDLGRMDVDVPTVSRVPMARWVKLVVKRLTAWYLNYLGVQITAFGQAVAHLGSLLVERTGDLEERTALLEADVLRLASRLDRLDASGRPADRSGRSEPPESRGLASQ